MSRKLPIAFFLAIGSVALATPPAPLESTALSRALDEGDCGLCHSVEGRPQAPRSESCTTCHIWIREVSADPAKRAKAVEIFELWPRYEKNVHSYLQVPSLEAGLDRLDPEWVRGYLEDPHDLRPHLDESMPTFALSEATLSAFEAEARARKATVAKHPSPTDANAARGETLYASKGCDACHTFGARDTTGVPQAPDLAHARARLDPDLAVAWIADPASVSKHATMPGLGLSTEDALALRDYLWLADPEWKPARTELLPVIPTTEPVGWDEVEARVFGKICAHCHMNPAINEGRAGPGNAGGFGHAATGVELETYEGVVAALERIPDALLRRRLEVDRDVLAPGSAPRALTRPDRPGMPLGHPPIPDEDISLVLGWIEQGAPR